MVSSSSVTGKSEGFGENEKQYFNRISDLHLKNPQIIGFGINSKEAFGEAIQHQKGAIIGSAFVQFMRGNQINKIKNFINTIL